MREDSSQVLRSPAQPAQWATLVDILRWRAKNQPNQRAYIFLTDGEQEEISLTYAQLDQQAQLVAAMLQQHTEVGDRALLLYPPGLEYIAAFLGCLYAGVIAVPAYPPSSNRSIARIQTIAGDAGAKLSLSTKQVLAKIRNWSKDLPGLSEMQWIATDDDLPVQADQYRPYTPTPNILTFLQYTSGSTGIPKGVMVSHGNLMHNSEMIRIYASHSAESIGVSWLPMFHDMGLIIGVLQPLYVGFPTVLMAPAAFIQRPLRWLQAISDYRGTTSYAPNFAYELCTNRITPEERDQLDLSTWKMAVNAAEPVRAETINNFLDFFAPCGLRRKTMQPAYGLAETTLMVSSCPIDAESTIIHVDKSQLEQNHVVFVSANELNDATVALVSAGNIAPDQQVVIANPETMAECRRDEIGEIWIKGPSITQGYWRRPEETEHTFHAYLADTGKGPFLRTGDLGFVSNEEVFITGRLKDLVIIRGRNYYPQDIEFTAERSHPSLRPGCGAAFSVEVANEERLVVVQEVSRHHEDPDIIIKAIRQAITEQYEIRAYAVVLIRYGSILKTSSGKIQRRACRDAFLNERFPVIACDILEETPVAQIQDDPEQQRAFLSRLENASPDEKRELLQALVTEQVHVVLGIASKHQITPQQNLLNAGMDSLTGTQLMNRLQNWLGRTLPNALTFVMQEPTIENLTNYLATEIFSLAAPMTSTEAALNEWLGELSEDETEARLMEKLALIEGEDIF